MKNEFIFIIFNYYFFNFIEYSVHQLAHSKKYGGFLYKEHYIHHKIFPPKKLMVKDSSQMESTDKSFSFIILCIYGLSYKVLETYYLYLFTINSIIYVTIIVQLHKHYHLINSPLDTFEWFKKRKELHHIHHRKKYNNYNLVFFTSDKIKKTYSIR